jgi:hypothetical protein
VATNVLKDAELRRREKEKGQCRNAKLLSTLGEDQKVVGGNGGGSSGVQPWRGVESRKEVEQGEHSEFVAGQSGDPKCGNDEQNK